MRAIVPTSIVCLASTACFPSLGDVEDCYSDADCPAPHTCQANECVAPRDGGTRDGGPEASLATLTVFVTGDGTVAADLPGLEACTETCRFDVAVGTSVTLTATPNDEHATFTWTGAGSGCGSAAVCTVDVVRTVEVGLVFELVSYEELSVRVDGRGRVEVDGRGCTNECEFSTRVGARVEVVAYDVTHGRFDRWGGSCNGAARTCAFTFTGAKTSSVVAVFRDAEYTIDVVVGGGGRVHGDGIDCGSDCSESYAYGTEVALTTTAPPNTGVVWNNCDGDTSGCTFTVEADSEITASFVPLHTIDVEIPSGGGRVTSTPAGIECPGTCAAEFPEGVAVTFTPTPDADLEPAGLTGCSGDPCVLTVAGASTVQAFFRPSGLVARWPFDGDANDVGGRGLHGAIVGTPVWTQGQNGAPNGAAAFSGDGTFVIDVVDDPALDAQLGTAFTLCGWLRADAIDTSGLSTAVTKDGSYALAMAGTGSPRATVSQQAVADGAQQLPAEWGFHCLVYDGGTASLYADGTLFAEGAVSGAVADTTSALRFGACPGTCADGAFIGAIDDVQLYDRALGLRALDVLRGTGRLGRFAVLTPLPSGRSNFGLATDGDFLWVIAGQTSSGRTNESYVATILPNGKIGPWRATTAYELTADAVTAVHHNGFVYVLGGSPGSGSHTDAVWYAAVNETDGTLGTWMPTTSLPGSTAAASATMVGSRVFIAGGCGGGSSVYSAELAATGGVTAAGWQTELPFPGGGSCWLDVDASSTHLYAFGTDGSNGLRTDIATLGPGPSILAWSANSTLPMARPVPRGIVHEPTATAFWIGGRTNLEPAVTTDEIWAADIDPSGGLSNWALVRHLRASRNRFGAVQANDRIYVVGGEQFPPPAGGHHLATVEVARVRTP